MFYGGNEMDEKNEKLKIEIKKDREILEVEESMYEDNLF
jgi:hypothetical protein